MGMKHLVIILGIGYVMAYPNLLYMQIIIYKPNSAYQTIKKIMNIFTANNF